MGEGGMRRADRGNCAALCCAVWPRISLAGNPGSASHEGTLLGARRLSTRVGEGCGRCTHAHNTHLKSSTMVMVTLGRR